jgi:hypothetical protein
MQGKLFKKRLLVVRKHHINARGGVLCFILAASHLRVEFRLLVRSSDLLLVTTWQGQMSAQALSPLLWTLPLRIVIVLSAVGSARC